MDSPFVLVRSNDDFCFGIGVDVTSVPVWTTFPADWCFGAPNHNHSKRNVSLADFI